MHWIQNESVAPYKTNISRQIWQNPFAEYAITQLILLSESDRLATFVQFFSMVASCITVSLIAQELGCQKNGQLLTSVLALTIPMGIMQSTTTQNDYVFTYWMVCFVYFSLRLLSDKSYFNATWLGLSLALGMLTKVLIYPYAAPFVISLGVFLVRKFDKKTLFMIFTITGLVILINVNFMFQNYQLYGQFIGTRNNTKFTNEVISLPGIASNVVRNIALHLWTPFPTVNDSIQKGIIFVHNNILHISVDDSRTTWGYDNYDFASAPNSEDYGGNPFHLFIIMLSVIIWLFNSRLRNTKKMIWVAGLLTLSFILFSGYLKWQPFHTRITLAFFVLWVPFVASVFDKIRKASLLTKGLPLVFLALSLPWVFYNGAKPIFPNPVRFFSLSRAEMLFFKRPELLEPYQGAVRFLKNNNSSITGILIDSDDWEYPLWAIANYYDPSENKLAFRHVILSRGEEHTAEIPPDYILTTHLDYIPDLEYESAKYELVWQSSPLAILHKENTD